jgi:hypothetical protein
VFGTVDRAIGSNLKQYSNKSATSLAYAGFSWFGRTDALCEDMMPQFIETLEGSPRPACTRVQARELLEGLRAAYQSLSPAERGLVKDLIGQAHRASDIAEVDRESECCESVS